MRSELQQIANEKADDARLLFDNGRFSGARYLAGYAVEIGLKAVIAARFRADEIPDKRFINSIYNHDLRGLVDAAELSQSLVSAQRTTRFKANWLAVEKWKPDDRYAIFAKADAEAMVLAVNEERYGVLEWIRHHW